MSFCSAAIFIDGCRLPSVIIDMLVAADYLARIITPRRHAISLRHAVTMPRSCSSSTSFDTGFTDYDGHLIIFRHVLMPLSLL